MKIVLIALLTAFLTLPNVASATWRHQQCRYQTIHVQPWTDYEVIRTIKCAVDHWNVPGGAQKAVSVAQCESGLEPNASNSIYSGVYQQAKVYWEKRYFDYRLKWWELMRNIWNARTNVVISVRMAHYSGWGAWACA